MLPVGGDLVGRDDELARLQAVLEHVAGGVASVVVVSGEAGIGKTAILDAVARRAGERGFAVAAGRCAVRASVPYWPWPRILRRLGGTDALDARAQASRAALFAAAADQLERSSAERPVLLMLDDLQWADESALALAGFLVAATDGLPIALAFAVRDDPAEMTPALRDMLAALPADVMRMPLTGLDATATAKLLHDVLGHEPSRDTAAVLHARTAGNPLFVQECGRLLATRGEPATTVVPERVRQAITRRLAHLPRGSYTTLAAAAVVDDFDTDLLGALTGMTPAALADGLADAVAARLVAVDEDGHRFAHALIRETLLDTQPAGSLIDLHRCAAVALEARLAREPLDTRAAVTARAARHWANVPGEGRDRAARLAIDAARNASQQFGYDHAAHLYRWALELGDDTLDTLIELGEAEILAGQLAHGRETLARAATRAAAERRGDALARAVLAAGAGVGGYEVDLRDERQVPLLHDALSLLGNEDSQLRAATLARAALVDTSITEERRAAMTDEAARMAARLGDVPGEVAALAARCDVLSGPDHVDARLAATARMVALAQSQRDPVITLVARRHRLLALLERGELAAVDDEIAAYARTSDHLRLPLYAWIVPVWRGMRALMEGDFVRAAQQCDAAEHLGRSAGSANAEVLAYTLRFAIARALGSTAALDADLERICADYEGYAASDGVRAVHSLRTDRPDAARRLVQRRMRAGIASVPRDSEFLETLWNLGEAAAAVEDLPAVEAIYDALVPYAELWAVDGIGAACYGSVSHILGLLAIALGRRDDARRWLEAAAHAHSSVGADNLVALTAVLQRRLGSLPPAPSGRRGVVADSAAFVRDGPVWHVRWQDRAATVRHSKGMLDIARLLAQPGREMNVLDLVDPTGSAPVTGGSGALLDATARRAYKRRLQELEEDLADASAMADVARAEHLERERDLLVAELARAYGIGGRARTAGDSVERARKAVHMRITTALRAIAAVHPELGRHLERSVVTGRYCRYAPEHDIVWRVTAEDSETTGGADGWDANHPMNQSRRGDSNP